MKDLISFVHEGITVDMMVDVVVVLGGDAVMDMMVDMAKQDELLSFPSLHAKDRFRFSESARCQDERQGQSANKKSL